MLAKTGFVTARSLHRGSLVLFIAGLLRVAHNDRWAEMRNHSKKSLKHFFKSRRSF
jgi:hypothetical protein